MAASKPIRIKIWPELESYFPLLYKIPARKANQNLVLLDFSRCRKIAPPAVAILLIRVLRYIEEYSTPTTIYVTRPEQRETRSLFDSMNFEQVVNDTNNAPGNELFERDLFSHLTHGSPDIVRVQGCNDFDLLFPIFFLNMKHDEHRRNWVVRLQDYLESSLACVSTKKNLNQLILILKEMAKNSADHTNGYAAVGMEIKNFSANERVMNFSYSDTGNGIHHSVWSQWTDVEKIKRSRHQGVAESYRLALQSGFSTKAGNGINMGIGMSIIMEGAKRLGVDLSVFDADSRGLLSDLGETSHSEIRKCFFHLAHNLGFAYYGSVRI